VLDLYTSRTPGSFIEEKSYSLAWHYRKTEAGLGILRSQEILADLRYLAADLGLQVLQGDKVIEIKNISVNKGKAAKRWLEKGDYDFILAIGDDHTDEDTFKAMPEDAITIKVGSSISAATYYLGSYLDVRKLLKEVCVAGSDEQDAHEALLENIY
jgi:trehalose 6-phosphate synthase/phosphatase